MKSTHPLHPLSPTTFYRTEGTAKTDIGYDASPLERWNAGGERGPEGCVLFFFRELVESPFHRHKAWQTDRPLTRQAQIIAQEAALSTG